jgi:hypothetical protein
MSRYMELNGRNIATEPHAMRPILARNADETECADHIEHDIAKSGIGVAMYGLALSWLIPFFARV